MNDKILKVSQLNKSYQLHDHSLKVLDEVNLEISPGETVAITGASGSGKSTLLGLCAGLDDADSGQILLCSQELNKLNEDERAALRLKNTSFIFQSFHLLPALTALENVMVPLELQGAANKETKKLAIDLLNKVGLEKRMDHYPAQLSGGEQQRVAIARAFATQPKILFADEPTGNLDTHTADTVQKLLFELNEQFKTTLIIVTHDNELAAKASRIIKMKGGKISE